MNEIESCSRLENNTDINEKDVILHEVEESDLNSSNSFMYLVGVPSYTKYISFLVLIFQIATFSICLTEASKEEKVDAKTLPLVVVRLFVAISISILLAMGFTDSWLTFVVVQCTVSTTKNVGEFNELHSGYLLLCWQSYGIFICFFQG